MTVDDTVLAPTRQERAMAKAASSTRNDLRTSMRESAWKMAPQDLNLRCKVGEEPEFNAGAHRFNDKVRIKNQYKKLDLTVSVTELKGFLAASEEVSGDGWIRIPTVEYGVVLIGCGNLKKMLPQ